MPVRTETGSKLTYEDYAAIPDDGRRHEIIDGTHFVNPAPRPRHQAVSRNLTVALAELQTAGRAEVFAAPIDVHLTEHDIVQPDLIAVAKDLVHRIGELKIEGAPQLVVEILSPSTRRLDRGAKRALYEAAGVLEYWIVDTDARSLTQLSLDEGCFVECVLRSGRVISTAFDGFEVALDSLFGG